MVKNSIYYNIKFYKGFFFNFRGFFLYSNAFKSVDYILSSSDKDNLKFFDNKLYYQGYSLDMYAKDPMDITSFLVTNNLDIVDEDLVFYDFYYFFLFEFDFEIKRLLKNFYHVFYFDFSCIFKEKLDIVLYKHRLDNDVILLLNKLIFSEIF